MTVRKIGRPTPPVRPGHAKLSGSGPIVGREIAAGPGFRAPLLEGVARFGQAGRGRPHGGGHRAAVDPAAGLDLQPARGAR